MGWAEVLVFCWWVREKHPCKGHSDQEDLDQAVEVILHASIFKLKCRLCPLIQSMNPEICQGYYCPEQSILKPDQRVVAKSPNEYSLEGKQQSHCNTSDDRRRDRAPVRK